jgi:hypothetical protein
MNIERDGYWQSMCRNAGATFSAFTSSWTVRTLLTGLALTLVGAVLANHFGSGPRALISREHSTTTIYYLVSIAASVTVLFLISLGMLSTMILVKANVYNSENTSIFSERTIPGFIYQDPTSKALLHFRRYIDDILKIEHDNSLSQVVAIRHWVRCQQPPQKAAWITTRAVDHEDPHQLLKEQHEGKPGACRRFCYILLGALLSAGFDARIVFFASGVRRHRVLLHAIVEVWIPELNQWVLLDPTYDCIVLIKGKVASAVDLYNAVESGDLNEVVFERNGSMLTPVPKLAFVSECCRHLFLALSNAIFDGYGVRITGPKRIHFLHYHSRGERYPTFSKRILLTLSSSCAILSIVLWALSLIVLCIG